MRKNVILLISAVVITALLTAPVFAWPDNVKGRPPFAVGKDAGYFIWHDEGGWHLRVTTKGAVRNFTGRIVADGPIRVTTRFGLEGTDGVVNDKANAISFRMVCKGVEDGFDFMTEGNTLTFHLFIDRKLAPKKFIFGGSGRNNPGTNPFTVNR